MLDIDIITLEPITSFSDLRDTDFYKANLNTEFSETECSETLVIHKRILYYWRIPFFSHLSHGKFLATKGHSWRSIHKCSLCGVNIKGIWLLPMLWLLLEQVWAALQKKIYFTQILQFPSLCCSWFSCICQHGTAGAAHQPRLAMHSWTRPAQAAM